MELFHTTSTSFVFKKSSSLYIFLKSKFNFCLLKTAWIKVVNCTYHV